MHVCVRVRVYAYVGCQYDVGKKLLENKICTHSIIACASMPIQSIRSEKGKPGGMGEGSGKV